MSHTGKIGNLQSHKSEAILLIFDLLNKHNKVQLLTSKDKYLYKNTEEHKIVSSKRVNPLSYSKPASFLRADFSL